MKKLLLSISLFALASDAISSDRGGQAKDSSYVLPKVPTIKKVGDGSHNKNKFSIMACEGQTKYYGQISSEMVATVPLLKEKADKREGKFELVDVKSKAILADVIQYVSIRHDILKNVDGAKEGMLDFVKDWSPEKKSVLRNLANALYREKHSVALLDLPVTKLGVFNQDPYDRKKVSIIHQTSKTTTSFFQISYEQAKNIGLPILFEATFRLDHTAIVERDFLNFANYVTIRNEEKDYEKLTLFVQGLSAAEQMVLIKSVAGFYKETYSPGFAEGIHPYVRYEIALFLNACKRGDVGGMKAVLSRNVTGVVCGVAALFAVALLIYKKLAS